MQKKINKISIVLSIALVFLGIMGFGQTTLDPTKKSIQAWMFPGYPNGITTINTESEFNDGRTIDAIKPEYLRLDDYGFLYDVHEDLSTTITTANTINAYSPSNVQYLFTNQNPTIAGNFGGYITISGSDAGVKKLLGYKVDNRDPFVTYIKEYLSNTGQFSGLSAHQYITNFKGVELDLELPGEWNDPNPYDQTYTNFELFKLLINELSEVLQNPINFPTAKELIITLPVDLDFTWFGLSQNINKYNYLCLMAYDRYWDIWDANNPNNNVTDNLGGVSPTAWVDEKIDKVISEMTIANINKIIIGMPSYGYHAISTTNFSLDTKKQTAANYYGPNLRDPLSFERYFTDANNIKWYYQDVIGMCEKIEFIRSKGIKHVSVWHLGGNDWFNRFDINISNNSILDPDYKLPATCLPASSIENNTSYSFPGQYFYSTTNKTIDNQNDRKHYAKINSSTANNTLEFGGYTFTPATPGNNYVSGFEVVVIGRTENNNSNLDDPLYKSDLFVQLAYNGQDAPPIPFSIYSHHAVCKLFGGTDDMMGLAAINGTINSSFKVKIYHSSGADACITAVFVKPYYSPSSPIPPSCTYNATPYNISTVMPVWSNTKLFNNDIVIKSGGVLTISGTLKFAEQSKIIVEPGGKLIVDGGTLTNLCNNQYWKGITVTGHYSQSQFDLSQHGKVSLINGASISNAVCAIQTLRENNDNTRGGGVIYAWNANFINNQTGVKMRKFTNKNLSGYPFIDITTFKNCNFITDNNYITPATSPFQQFINLDKIKGVEIFGCQFKNNSTNIAPDFSNAGIGIYSNESYYNIDNSVNQTEFYKLQYGIKSILTITEKPIRVKRALFNQNLHGIFAMNSANGWFTANTFKIPERFEQVNNNLVNTNSAYGMYLDHCTGYTVEGNTFNKITGVTNNASYGLIINESGAPAALNSIYNNAFQNIEHASTQVQGNNRGSNYNNGLKILCNQFTSNNKDITVFPFDPLVIPPTDGISEYQGTNAYSSSNADMKKPAGNTFSKTGPIANYTDINNQGLGITYFHHKKNNDADIWFPLYSNPSASSIGVFPSGTFPDFPISDRRQACPEKALQTGLAKDPIAINTYITEKTLQKNSAKLILDLWKDGGNTQGLVQEVELAYPWEAYIVYNDLLIHSPYLSDEVLIEAIQNEEVLPPVMLKLILLANPQACRSDVVMEALYNRVNPLPEAMIDEIMQGLEVISPLENLEADVSYYASERKTYLDMLKQYYMEDTAATGMQNLIQLLGSETDIESRYELVFAQIANQDFEGALITFSDIEGMIIPDSQPEEMDRYNKMSNVLPILINVESGNVEWENIEPTDKDYLIELSDNDRGMPGSLARAARMQFEPEYIYEEPIYTGDDIPLKIAGHKKQGNSVINESILKIAPNPANEFVSISYNIIGLSNALRLEITDVMGKKVYEKELSSPKDELILVVLDYAKGNYICTIFNNGKPLQSTKFIKK
jgi:hypothetical protein